MMEGTPTPAPPFSARSTQVAEYLKQRIQAGDWQEYLPGERILSKQIGVSRRTINAALEELRLKGWLLERGPRGTRLRNKGQAIATPPEEDSIGLYSVGLFLPVGADEVRHRVVQLIDELRRILYEYSIRLHVYQRHFATEAIAAISFRKLTQTMRHTCWILPYSNRLTQKWCVSEQIPAIIMGNPCDGVNLPSVNFNYRASSRHAASQIHIHGHRSIAIVQEKNERQGDRESKDAFCDAASANGATAVSVAYHNGTTADLCNLANRLLARKHRPTAWFIASPDYFLTIMTYLLHRGIKIPEEISLVCRDADSYLSKVVPEPTRYVFDPQQQVKQVARLVQKFARGGMTSESLEIIPDFKQGKTLGPAPLTLERKGSN